MVVCWCNGVLVGPESAIRPDSLQRAGALGLLHRLLAMDVVDAEGLVQEGEDKTRGNGRQGTFNETRWMRNTVLFFSVFIDASDHVRTVLFPSFSNAFHGAPFAPRPLSTAQLSMVFLLLPSENC